MINVVGAGGEDASLVVLPARSINADRDGATRVGAELAVLARLAGDGVVVGNAGNYRSLRERAAASTTATSSVGVVGIGINTASALDILVGTSGETATATLILTSSVAV